MSLQWTEDSRCEGKGGTEKPHEEKEVVNKARKPLKRKDLTREIGRYENRTHQKLIQLKYHTQKFLALVNTFEKQKKLSDAKEAEKAARGGKQAPQATIDKR